ncbi:MAG: ABC transporter substrate-binding protein [Oscillospiraceae bacterium]|nr:ABC transporter substrate-binding protein [Oscillospiraceae bacterium]
MKKIASLLLAVCLLLALTACGSAKTETAAPAADASADASVTLTAGKLAVGVEIGYPPMEYFDEDGSTAIGFDVEMFTEIASRMGLELEIVDTAWDGIFAGLESDKYDMIMSSCSITPARQNSYLMGEPYVQNAIELLVPVDSDITGIEDVTGRSVAVQGETSSHDYLRDNDTGCEIRDYDKVINCFDELKLGRVDAVLTDSVVAAYYLGSDIDNYKVVWVNEEAEPIGVTYKKGNEALYNAIEEVLDAMSADGTTAKIATKYFGDASGVDGLR